MDAAEERPGRPHVAGPLTDVATDEEVTRRILDVAHDAFVGMDEAGRIVAWNPAAERCFGRSAAEVAGADLAETIIPPRFHAAHRRGLERFLATGEGVVIDTRVELVALRASGEEFPVELTISHVESHGDRLFFAFVRDLSEARRAAAERGRAERYLAVQHEVARVLAAAPDRAEAIPALMRAVGEPLGWAVGEFWLVDDAVAALRCVGSWQAPGVDLDAFVAGPEDTIARGEGLVGRVWEHGRPVWLDATSELATLIRREAARRGGMRCAIGLPITAGDRVIGALDFLSAEGAPDQDLLDVLTTVCQQVGQFLERERAQAAQAASEATFRFLTEHASDMISRHRQDGTFLYASPASLPLYGYRPEELVGRSPYPEYHPDDLERVRAGYARLQEASEPTPMEYRRRRKDGSYVWVESRARRITNAETGEPEILASTRDVSDRKRMEQELRQSRELLRAMLDHTPALVFSKDLEGRFLFINREFERIFGVADADAVGRTDGELWGGGPEEVEAVRRNDRLVVERGEPVVAEEVVSWEGSQRTYLSTKFPLLDDDGRPYATCGIAVDITDRKRNEEALQAANAELERRATELERSNEELARFAHIASHDLAAPLRVVVGYLQLLRRLYRDRLGADADELIDGAVGSAHRMRALIDDLLDYASVGSGPRPFEPVALGPLLAEVVRLLEPVVAETRASVVVAELPTVPGDRGELLRLFQNLVANALKFRRPGQAPRIRVDARPTTAGWQIRVQDDGIGVEADHADRIFVMFGRLHGADAFPGTGAGLAICKKVAEHHGGSIAVEPTPGGGSTFVVTLPAS